MNQRNRVSGYRVVRRYRGTTGRGVGRVYEAFNDETGAPALVLTPGRAREWWPRGSWKLTVAAGSAPPRVTLEATQPPTDDDLNELPEMLMRMTAGLGDVIRRPDGRAHLAGERGRVRRARAELGSGRMVRTVLAAAAVCALAVVAGVLAGTAARRPTEVVGALEASRAEPIGSFTYTAGQLPMAPMPTEPFARQKRPPCEPRVEEEVAGGCWTVLKVEAPCPATVYERDGRCYRPALAEAKPGQSWRP